ncbi:MAG TPA: HD domain-containing phosphohydrolase [Thermodesulfobacteriota bacterium]|nr:HD domain-containing phosphohydrolase [Thermodesulfobacteriota bacterium]
MAKPKEKEKVLIVDDEETVRDVLKYTLEELGYVCESAENGFECLKKVYSHSNYEIILLDVNMPMLNGIETLKKLKSYSPDISVIMISAARDAGYVREALKEGAYDYIFKPFNFSDIELVIRRAVERSKLIKENKDYQQNLERKVAEQTEELLNLYSDTLEAMILALDLRERETGFHSYRVTEYSVNLGRHMGLSDSELSIIAKGALLHDIGKIGIPDSILLKPDELTEDEREKMKEHPIYGYELLKKIQFLEPAARIVLSHHERFDGQGYPNGISGKDIPLGARIFSIVDTMDALTSDRMYRKAISFDEARQEISVASGSQFDPEAVKEFLSIPVEEWIEIRKNIERSGSAYLKNLSYRLKR